MKNRRSNWQIVVSGILIFAVWIGALPVYAQTKKDGKGVGVKIVTELPSKEKRWALIVGIDEYQNDVSSLKGSVNDARALKNVLVNNAGFPENQIILLTTDSAEPDKRPTRENILGALSDLYSRVPADGLLLFSFSGHGISVGNQAFLIPSNGRFTKNPELLQDFSIDVSRIKRAIETMKVKQVLMLLDACRNEPGKGDTPNKLTNTLANGFSFDVANSDVKAFATLYATSIGERAYEFYDKDTKQFRGYFSHAVEEALKGKAANEKGEVTLSRLIDYLETTVPKKVKYDKGETQIPTANYSESYRANQLILAVGKPSKSDVATQPTKPTSSPIVSKAKNNEEEFWEVIKISTEADDFRLYNEKYPNGVYKNLAELKIKQLTRKDNKTEITPAAWSKIRETARSLLKYDSVGSFSDGLAEVRIGEFLRGKYGYIDKTGREVVALKYDYVDSFSDGLAMVRIGDSQTGKYGYIDKTGREIIALKYDVAKSFSDGLAPVGIGKPRFAKYGYIDKTGREVVPPTYYNAGSFSDGLAPVDVGFSYGKYGYIDKTGREVIDLKYGYAASFSDGLAMVRIGDWNTGKFGYIDKTGREVVALKYDYAASFSDGLAPVGIGEFLTGKYGYIDKTGREVVALKYDDAYSFSDGLAEVRIGDLKTGKYGMIDKTGREIVPVKYDEIWCRAFVKEGFIGVKLNGKKGFVDIYGNEYFDF